ncbi:MAG: YidC/Oxa1 family insertase periplasmic-domain containing protein, partial [Candidatus Zixiibacteriota bacterium]
NDRDRFGFERQYSLVWNTSLGVTEPQAAMDYDVMEAVAMQAGARENLDDFDDGRLNQSLDGFTSWAGLRSKYFAAVIIPKNRDAESVFAKGNKRKVKSPDGEVEQRKIIVGLDMPFANVIGFADSFTVFVGPLDYTLLSKYKVGLEDMLGIGTTPIVGWLIKPFAIAIIWLLPKMYSVIPNYGLVIILFAFLVKVITLPLSMKSFKSMNAMKELQPKIEELKKKHKNNPQALNSEMMKMYKTHGVNPISGCLPMLPQMPLFFALFSVFRQTILLRDAPFIWFITDLSRGAMSFTDPYIILVVIMIAAQFVSQKLTMSTAQQNKALQYAMPLFMGFIFYKFAAGLVLYWACFSIFSLLDYVIFKRKKNIEVKTI